MTIALIVIGVLVVTVAALGTVVVHNWLLTRKAKVDVELDAAKRELDRRARLVVALTLAARSPKTASEVRIPRSVVDQVDAWRVTPAPWGTGGIALQIEQFNRAE